MTELFTAEEALNAVPGLSRARLAGFIKADLITVPPNLTGPVFRPMDLARLELLCDLADQFGLDADALGVVMALIDQLHRARHELHAIARAMDAEPQELRQRVGARLLGFLTR